MSCLKRIITGGQSGADQAAWRAARAAGLKTGGAMPRGFQTEDGPRPELAAQFGAEQHESPDPADRTVANVHDSDATLVFAPERPGAGTMLTIEACRETGAPCLVVHTDELDSEKTLARIADQILALRIRTLNVAGDRESTLPGIGATVEDFLTRLFHRLDAADQSECEQTQQTTATGD